MKVLFYFFVTCTFVALSLPATWTHELWIGPIHFFNLFYLLIAFSLFSKIKNLTIVPLLLFLYGLGLGILSFYTYEHFVIKFFFKDLIIFSAIICGSLFSSLNAKTIVNSIRHSFFICLILLTIIMYTNALGLTGNNHSLRLYDDSNFYSAYYVILLRPFALYFTNKKEVISYYIIKYSWTVPVYFAIVSATRSVLIVAILSLILGYLVNSRLSLKQFGYITFIGVLGVILLSSGIASNIFIVQRLLETSLEDEARLIELFFMVDAIGDKFWGLGYGSGFMSYLNIINEEQFGDRPVAYPHLGFFTFYLKGGIIYMLMALYMLFYAIYALLSKPTKFKRIFAYMILIHFALSLISGGYSFMQFLFLFYSFYTLSSKTNYKRYHVGIEKMRTQQHTLAIKGHLTST